MPKKKRYPVTPEWLDAVRAEMRNRDNMSQVDLARLTGASQPAIHKILVGDTASSEHVPKITKALGLETGDDEVRELMALFTRLTAKQRRQVKALVKEMTTADDDTG